MARTAASNRIKIPGNSLSFTGTNNVSVTSAASIQITGDMTIAAWVKVTNTSNYRPIVEKATSNKANPYELYIGADVEGGNAGKLKFIRGDGSTVVGIWSSTAVPTGSWQFVAVTQVGTAVTFYLNGKPDGTGTISTSTTDAGGALLVGRRPDGLNFLGNIDDVWIYSRALSAQEIQDIYFSRRISTANLSLWHRFDEGSGTVPVDYSGNNNVSAITGATYSTDTPYTAAGTSASARQAIGTILATGGNISSSGYYKIHTFLSDGTFTVTQPGNVEILVVGGGGGGGSFVGGGGGGASVEYNASFAVTAQAYNVVVGGGGSGAVASTSLPTNGVNSTFSTITAYGGGKGGTYNSPTNQAPASGGSGGGGDTAGGLTGAVAGSGSNVFAGGNGTATGYAGGGGGGASATGTNATPNVGNGHGGNGYTSTISGSSQVYGGGGGGGGYSTPTTPGNGGTGGGGNGGNSTGPQNGFAGTANTGGGGGGSGATGGTGANGGNGGSGIVIIRYIPGRSAIT